MKNTNKLKFNYQLNNKNRIIIKINLNKLQITQIYKFNNKYK